MQRARSSTLCSHDHGHPLDGSDIAREFTRNAAQRGLAYQREGRVRTLSIDDDGTVIEARVQGNTSRPYRVSVKIVPVKNRDHPVMFIAECNCPVMVDCKHAAAALYEALAPAAPAAPAPKARPPADPLAGPLADWLGRLQAATATPVATEMVIYVLDVVPHGVGQRTSVTPGAVRRLKGGGLGQPRNVQLSTIATSNTQYVRPEDRVVAQLLTLGARFQADALPADAEAADLALRRMVATGRCHWKSRDNPPLSLGPTRPGRLSWRILDDGRQVPVVEADGPAEVLPGAMPWYVDTESAETGPLDLGMPTAVATALLQAPPVAPSQVALLRAALAEKLPGIALAPPAVDVVEETITEPPVPVLRLSGHEARIPGLWYYQDATTIPLDVAQLAYDYGGLLVDPAKAPLELRRVEGRRVLVRSRDIGAERAAHTRLVKLGLSPYSGGTLPGMVPNRIAFTLPQADDWPRLVHRELPTLAAEGWRIEFDPSFRHRVVDASGDWQADVAEADGEGQGGWWFSLDLGIELDGERIPLLPVLVQALKRLRDPAGLAVDGTLYARLPDGRLAALPFDRVRALLATLVELFDTGALSADGRLDCRWARRWAWPRSRRRCGCAGSAANGCASWRRG